MEKKTTNELLAQILISTESEMEQLLPKLETRSFCDYLNDLLKDKGLSKSALLRRCSIPRTYFYQLFQGTRRPGRDKVLVLAIAMECTLEKCNRLLTLAHQSILYARNPRDAIILHALHAHRTLFQLEESLQAHNLPLLQRYE